jgi:hypothetical protein
MNERNSLSREQPGAKAPDYEPPAVFDLGKVLDVTSGDSQGASDENGQQAS